MSKYIEGGDDILLNPDLLADAAFAAAKTAFAAAKTAFDVRGDNLDYEMRRHKARKAALRFVLNIASTLITELMFDHYGLGPVDLRAKLAKRVRALGGGE